MGKKVLEAPGAERVAELEGELRLAAGLTALREEVGLSQRDLARRIGVSQPRVAKIEQSHNVTVVASPIDDRSSPKTTALTASSLARMVIATSTQFTASATLSASRAPAATSYPALPFVQFHTVTRWPPSGSLPTSARPSVPSPTQRYPYPLPPPMFGEPTAQRIVAQTSAGVRCGGIDSPFWSVTRSKTIAA